MLGNEIKVQNEGHPHVGVFSKATLFVADQFQRKKPKLLFFRGRGKGASPQKQGLRRNHPSRYPEAGDSCLFGTILGSRTIKMKQTMDFLGKCNPRVKENPSSGWASI